MAGWVFNTGGEDAATIGIQITTIAVIFTALSFVFLSLRLYVRFVMIKATGADDWAAIVSWIGCLGFTIVTIIQTRWGLGLQHLSAMPDENVYTFGLLQFIGAPFYISSILFFKLALLFSYLRILTDGIWRTVTIIAVVGCILFHISFLVTQINLCTPVAKQWDPSITGGSCLPSVKVYTSMASLTIFFDVIVMALPFPVLAKLQIPRRKKTVLLSLFALGLFITIIQIIRILTIKSLANYLDSDKLILWSTVENNVGLIVACVPTLSPLIKYFNERTRGSYGSRKRSDQHGDSQYALRTWGTGGRGVQQLGSGVDIQPGYKSDRVKSDGDSTDSILGMNSTTGILRKTEVTVITDTRELEN